VCLVDVTSALAGPYCTEILAALRAEIRELGYAEAEVADPAGTGVVRVR
jgi:crotonobetainyl-CoA:carnitine CoA-transferase CaiB-like acyl-CoA transferase